MAGDGISKAGAVNSFKYVDGVLAAESAGSGYVSLQPFLASYTQPTIIYSKASLVRRVNEYKKAFTDFDIHYALKANHHPELLKVLKSEGLNLDVVSLGEIEVGLNAGFQPGQIIFSGVGKTRHEIQRALELGVSQLNVESPAELNRIAEIAKGLKVQAPVAFRLNPDVSAKTHPYIATGFRENKFGMDSSFLPGLIATLRSNPSSLQLVGLTFHIGSQLFDLDSWSQSLDRLIEVYKGITAEGFDLQRLDIGGGVGIHYAQDDECEEIGFLKQYGQMASRKLQGLGCRLQCEPGRFIVARSAALITQVQYIKRTPYKKFVITDSGMNHLIRPALYEAFHRIVPVKLSTDRKKEVCDVVGPICESADFFAKSILLPDVHQDELLAVMDVGAYASVMALDYNCHPRAIEIVI